MKYLITVLLALAGFNVSAATYYYSKCDTGAHASCIAGSDSNAGTSPAAPKLSLPTNPSGNDTHLFARGASWADAQQLNSWTGSNWTMADYTPTWCTGGCTSVKPKFYAIVTAGVTQNLIWSYNRTNRSNITLRNLHLIGGGDGGGKAITLGKPGDVTGLVVDGVEIEGFGIGFDIRSNGLTNKRLTVKNSNIHDNKTIGFFGAVPQMLIENNTFDKNGVTNRDHNIYLSGETASGGTPVAGIIVRGNTLTGAGGYAAAGVCDAASLIAHDTARDLIIENNLIYEASATGGCYGITIDSNTTTSTYVQDMTRLIIRGNRVVMNGSGTMAMIGCSSCPGAIIEDNIIVRLGGSGTTYGIWVPSSSVYQPARGDVADTYVTIRNNSIWTNDSDATTVGIRVNTTGTGDTVTSNVIYMAAASASAKCFEHGARAIGTFTAFNNNTCYRVGGDAVWSSQYSTLALAQAAGFDAAGSKTDPGLTTPTEGAGWIIAASSGASSIIDSGHVATASRYGFRGKARNGARDRGACEYRTGDACSAATTSVPSFPTWVR